MTRSFRLLPLALGLAVFTTGCGVGGFFNELSALRAFQRANLAYQNQEYEEALAEYNAAMPNAPMDDPIVQTTLRFFSASSNHLLYNPGAVDDPENESRIATARQLYEETLDVVREASNDPSLDDEQRELIATFERYSSEQLAAIHRDVLRDLGEAEKYFNRLIELDPNEPGRYYALADLYERFHDEEENPLIDKVVAAYEKPVEMNPQDPIGYRQVANLLNKYGRFDETMEWLGRARDVNPDNPEGYYLISTYYWDKVYRDPDLTSGQRSDYIDLGIEQLDVALEINADYVDALVYKNLLLREKAKTDPRNANAYIAEADTYRARALELREAQQEAQRAAAAAAAEAAASGAATAAEEPQ